MTNGRGRLQDDPKAITALSACKAYWDMGFHKHEGLEISIVLEGKGGFDYDGVITPIEKGDIVLIAPHVEHRYFSENDPIRFAVLVLSNMASPFMEGFFRLLAAEKFRILHFSPMQLEQYETLFRVWLRMLSDQTAHAGNTITIWGDLFLLFIEQNGRTSTEVFTVASAAEYIRTQLEGEVKVGELAQLCGLSDSSFRRFFHSTYGMAPKQYQQMCRMTEAKWLLRSSTSSIQQIAEQVGFSGVHAFSSWFHLRVGISPSEWRKKQYGAL